MSLTVTPGYGAQIATELMGGQHVQQVVAHAARFVSGVTPGVPQLEYQAGKNVGGELSFVNAARLADTLTTVQAVRVVVVGQTAGVDLDLFLYSESLPGAAGDGGVFTVPPERAPSIGGVVRVRASDFANFGGNAVATVPCSIPLKGSATQARVVGQLVAASDVTFQRANDPLRVSLVVDRG